MADHEQPDYTTLTVQLLSAYVANNLVESTDLAALIQSTRAALVGEVTPPEPAAQEHVPAVSVRKSIASKDHIISLIDGRSYKTLKRHLSAHGLTPDTYRERYGLPKTYPMVAPDYADIRRAVAQRNGLGQRSAASSVEAAAPAQVKEVAAAKPASRRKPTAAKTPAPEVTPVVDAAVEKPKAVAKAKAAPVAKSTNKSSAKSNVVKTVPTTEIAPDSAANAAEASAPNSATRRKLGIKTPASSSPARKSKAKVETAAE